MEKRVANCLFQTLGPGHKFVEVRRVASDEVLGNAADTHGAVLVGVVRYPDFVQVAESLIIGDGFGVDVVMEIHDRQPGGDLVVKSASGGIV